MKKTLLVFLLPLLCYCNIVNAQTRLVSGSVINAESGVGLAGVTVGEIGNPENQTSTDIQGIFSLRLNSGRVIKVSALGFATEQVAITDQTNVTIKLIAQNTELSGVVITAYGTTKAAAFTGTAAIITNEKFKDLQATSIAGVLQGNASGVLAVTNSGQPGENPTVRIRGIGSYNASNEPLYLVDGAPYPGNVNSINPNEIESITVLKDASATSIYGSRAANGIIQITTKKGNGKAKVQFSSVTGISKRAVADYKTLNSSQYMELFWEALKNDAIANPALLNQFGVPSPEAYATGQLIPRTIYNPFSEAQPVGMDGKIKPGAKLLWEDNWVDAATRNGIRNDINLNISGGEPTNTVRYFLSGGLLKDQGILKESEFKRYTGRARIDATPTKWLRVGVNTSLAKSNQNFPYQGGSNASNVLAFARNIAPIYPVYLRDRSNGSFILDATGRPVYDFGNNTAVLGVARSPVQNRPYVVGQNSIGTVSINPTTHDVLTSNNIIYAEMDLAKGLTARSQYSFTYNQVSSNTFWNPFYGDGITNGGYSYRGVNLLSSQNISNTINYDKNFGKHHVMILAGQEAFKQTAEFTSASATGFTFESPTQPGYGATKSGSGAKRSFNLESYFSRFSYDFKDKYHLSVSLRTDGSTRFADGHRWGSFYATGASWNIDKEKFLSAISWLSSLKLKLSYGTTGNQALPSDFPYLGTYSSGNNVNNAAGAVIATVANFDLTWEKQKQLDMGLEFGLLNDRISGSFVYFDRRSDNLLFQRPLPGSTGINSISDNVGGLRNYGWEAELNTINIKTAAFTWKTSFNITKLRNVISEAFPGTTTVVGGSLYDWIVRRYAGVNPANGNPQWDQDDPMNPGKVLRTENFSQATLYRTGNGNSLSDYTGGIFNSWKYKNFDLSVLASFGLGGKYYDLDYAGLMAGAVGANNISRDIYGRWQSPEQPGNGIIPRVKTTTSNLGTFASTRFLYDATFMRVRNITFGYNVPGAFAKKVGCANIRVYADLQNAFTFFGGPKGTDPEQGGLNALAENNNTTAYKTLAIGLNVGF
jgi:TonB-linked SusC/RagA family outer membrane protein